MGLDYWDKARCLPLSEPRLLRAIQRAYGGHIQEIRNGPKQPETGNNPFPLDPSGVPTSVFPRWLRCPLCSTLAPLESGLFKLQTEAFRTDRTRYIHEGCQRRGTRTDSSMPAAVPSRFVVACEHGHLEDFPWDSFVHRGSSCSTPRLRLFESGVSGEAADVMVRCESCEKARPMSEAFGRKSDISCAPCNGYHAHLHGSESGCSGQVKTLLIGASNSYFPISVSVLSLPSTTNPIEPLLQRYWPNLASVLEKAEVAFLRRRGELGELDAYSDDQIWEGIERLRNPSDDQPNASDADIKRPEWQMLSASHGSILTERLTATAASSVPPAFARFFTKVVLVERFTEVRALVGFTRIESAGDMSELDSIPAERRAPLSRRKSKWVPGVEVKGEGVFIQFNEFELAKWEGKKQVTDRVRSLQLAHSNWCNSRQWMAKKPSAPTARYGLLHTLSHLLMREMGIRCGYGTASLRERIYCASANDNDGPMAGIFIGTSSSDSEGTLGGLVALGQPNVLEEILRAALLRASLCSSDPICASYDPSQGQKLHGAACHSCSFVPETSCERSNSFLDRALVVETIDALSASFFGQSAP